MGEAVKYAEVAMLNPSSERCRDLVRLLRMWKGMLCYHDKPIIDHCTFLQVASVTIQII